MVIDTNLWISFLIGKRTANLVALLSRPGIKIALSEQAVDELRHVVSREKFRKYFPLSYSERVFDFLKRRATTYRVTYAEPVCRDPKDDYLLALSSQAHADYLITGDTDLLSMGSWGSTTILTLQDFMLREQ